MARICPAQDLKLDRRVTFQRLQQAVAAMHREGLYDSVTGWLPASEHRIMELLQDNAQLNVLSFIG